MAESQYAAAPHYYPQQGHHYPSIAYQFSPQHGTFIPMPVVHAMDDFYTPGGAVFQHQQQLVAAYPPQYSPAPSTTPAEPSTGQSSVAPSPPPAPEASHQQELRGEQHQQEIEEQRRLSFPDTCYTEGYEYSYEASVLHRQLKRAIMSGAAGEGLSAYRAMERYFPIQSLTPISDCQQTFISCSVCHPESKSTSPELKSLSL